MTICALSVFAAAQAFCAAAATADVLDGIAAIGAGSSSNAPTNYPGILQDHRGLNFGGPGIPYAVGYVGADAGEILALGNQVDQTVAQILGGNVTLVTMTIGDNDYIDVGDQIAAGALAGAALTAFQAQVANDIATGVNELRAAGAAMVLGGFANIVYSPAAADIEAIPIAKARLEGALSGGNDLVRDYANAQGIPYIDFFALQTDVYEAGVAEIGGVNLILTGYGADPHYFFQDPYHAGILVRGAIANLYLQAINAGYGTNIPLLTDLEILTLAGLEDEYVNETFNDQYAYPAYVSVPEPSAVLLAGVGLAAVAACATRRRMRRSLAIASQQPVPAVRTA
ncbi:MAG: PEP-CTERM sorting domain-containing protein [Pirellulales bacterium]